MNKITSEDIKALREYLDKAEALEKEQPEKIKFSTKELEKVWTAINLTGKPPKKYRERITVRELDVLEGIETIFDDKGKPHLKHVKYKKPQKRTTFYDTLWEEWNRRRIALDAEYHDSIVKVFGNATKEDKDKTLKELIEAAITPEVLDITNLPNLLPTDKNLQYAITPYRNENAYIMRFDYNNLHFDYDENGELIISTQAQFKAVEKAKDKENKIEAHGIDQPLLRQLFAASMKAYLCNYGNSITVYLPSFAHEMGIDVYYSNLKAEARNAGERSNIPKHNSNDFFKKLEALEKLNGVWQGGSFYRVFVLEGYEAEQNTLTFSSPWLFKIARELLTNPTNKKTRSDGSIMWEITGISSLMKPSIASARSKPTVEILASLLVGLQQYGTKPEAKRHPGKKYKDKEMVEYKISFKTLIDRIPLITETLDKCKPSNKTTLLQRYFCGSDFKKRQKEGKGFILEEYITEHTFIKDYYKDFNIIFQPPTVKTLSDKITIRHRGINGDFTANNALNELLFRDMPQEESVVTPEE